MLLFHALPQGGHANVVISRPPPGGRENIVISRPPFRGGVQMLLFHALLLGGRENVVISRPPILFYFFIRSEERSLLLFLYYF